MRTCRKCNKPYTALAKERTCQSCFTGKRKPLLYDTIDGCMSHSEIGRVLGISKAAVQQIERVAMDKLRVRARALL